MSSTRRATIRVKQEQADNGGEEERDSKRPCTSKPISSKVIIGSDTTMVNDVAAPSSSSIAPQSKAAATSAASAIKNKITSKKNGDTSGNGNGDINNDNNNIPTRLPTKEELKKELYKLVDTDHFSRDESLQALHRIDQWNDINDNYNDGLYFRDYFYNYGGLQIVLDFVENFSNDAECVESTKLFLQGDMLSELFESRDIIFNHGVIQFLLQSISKIAEGNLDGPKLKALENIWDLIDTIFGIIGYGRRRRKIDVSSNSFKNRFYSIVNSCLDLLTKLQSHDIQTSFDIMSKTLSILVHVTSISKTMKDCAVEEKLRDKGIIPKMLELFKKVDVRDEKLLRSALRMLEDLNDENLLTQASDFQSLLPLLVAALKNYPGPNIITMVEKATDTTESKLILEKAGVLGSLVSLLEKNSTTDDDDDDDDDENLTSLSSSYPSDSSSSSSESTYGDTAAERSIRRRQKKTRWKEKWDKHTRRERKRENDRMKDIVRNLVAKICTR
jgi:hypothetical protein